MGRGKSGKAVSVFRKESGNPNSQYKPTIPRKIRELNSRLYDSLRAFDNNWKKEGEFVSYESNNANITCNYSPDTISHKSRKLYHQDKKCLMIHIGGLPTEPTKDEIKKYVGLEAEVTCFGRGAMIKLRTHQGSEQDVTQADIEHVVEPLLHYARILRQ